MTKATPLLHLLLALFFCASHSDASPTTNPVPRDREFSWMSVARWYRMHADDVELAAKGEAQIVFLGDSITEGYEWSPAWKRDIVPFKPANLAIGGDKTQNLLWRLQHGAAGTLDPKLVVMLIGVNNFLHDDASAQATFAGVAANLEQAKVSFPRARILLLGVFPYGESADDPNRKRVALVNEFIATLADDRVTVLDIGDAFLEEDGSISKDTMGDFLHPSAEGYERMSAALLPTLQELMDE